MSSVGGWKVEACDSVDSAREASNTVTGIPRRTRQAAAVRPTGPAPAINTRSSAIMAIALPCALSFRRRRAVQASFAPDVDCLEDRPPLGDFGFLQLGQRFGRFLVAR